MDMYEQLERYRRRLAIIGLKKAIMWALVFGFVLEFITAFILWFFKIEVWVAILIMLAVLIVGTGSAIPAFYFGFYEPVGKRMAAMIDKLGLEERIITVYEHEDDDSDIAWLQREEARKTLGYFSERQFLFRLSKFAAIALAVSIGIGVIMSTVSTCSAVGLLPSGSQIFGQEQDDNDDDDDDDSLCVVVYTAAEGGIIIGEGVQTIQRGEDTQPVTALPDIGYEFVGWSDGDPRVTRVDYGVQESMSATAMFVLKAEFEVPGDEGGGGTGGGGMNGDEFPGDSGFGGDIGESGNPEDNNGDDVGGSDDGGAGAEHDDEDNSVLDGSSDYKNVFDYQSEVERLLENENLPDEVKDYLNKYLDALKRMQEADNNAG